MTLTAASHLPVPSALMLTVGIAVSLAVVITVAAFVAQYTVYAPWWRDEVGRTIVIKDICLILAILPGLVLRFAFRDEPHLVPVFQWAQIIVVGLIAPTMVWRMWVWRKIHRKR